MTLWGVRTLPKRFSLPSVQGYDIFELLNAYYEMLGNVTFLLVWCIYQQF